MTGEQHEKIENAIRIVGEGGMVIVVDDEDRENEGDLIVAAEKATPEQIAFIVRHTSGILCAPLERELARKLNLAPMVAQNDAPLSTAFTVSVDFKHGLTTGISASERCATVRALANPNTGAADFVRPGHVFPLIACDGGVLMRTGHTEAAVDLARLAGCAPVGLIGELVNDDGTVKKGRDIVDFSSEYDVPIVSISDLIAYRQAREVLIERVGEANIVTKYGPARAITYSSRFDDAHHVAVVFGDPNGSTDILVRFQLENVIEDVFGGEDGAVLTAIERMSEARKGVLVYLRQGAAGVLTGVESHAGDGSASSAARREQWKDIGLGAQILRNLGLRSIRLLASKERQYVGLQGFGIEIIDTETFG